MNSANTDKLPISVIIVNFNAGYYLRECVSSCLEQVSQVIVVDNGSTDRSLEELGRHYPDEGRLSVIRNDENYGFSVGSNRGFEAATEEYILFLNPDCFVLDGSLDKMLQVLKSHHDIGMVGGYLANPDMSEQRGGRRVIPTPWRSFVRTFGLYRFVHRWSRSCDDIFLHQLPTPKVPTEVEAISGALMLTDRKSIKKVGLFDENYFLHCEDLDWCMRFKLNNLKIVYVPDSPVVHYRGICSRDKPIFVEWNKHKGMVLFYKKFFRQQYPIVVTWLIKAGVWLRFSLIVSRFMSRKLYNSMQERKVDLLKKNQVLHRKQKFLKRKAGSPEKG